LSFSPSKLKAARLSPNNPGTRFENISTKTVTCALPLPCRNRGQADNAPNASEDDQYAPMPSGIGHARSLDLKSSLHLSKNVTGITPSSQTPRTASRNWKHSASWFAWNRSEPEPA
jgi:hypothetical protein